MPNDERTATALDRFIGELWRAWTMAGPPSYGEFETLSRRVCGPGGVSGLQAGVLYASTTQEILTGQRRRPPKWQWVARFVTVLRVTAAESGMDPNSLGTFAEWKAKHEAACADLAAAPRVAAVPVESGQVVTYESAAYAVPRQAAPPSLNKSSSGALDGELLTTVGRAFIAGWWHEFRDVVPDWFQDYLSLEPARTTRWGGRSSADSKTPCHLGGISRSTTV